MNVVITKHASERMAEHGLNQDEIEAVVRRAIPFAPRWPEAAAALESEVLPADPLVKYFSRTAVVTTLLPHGVPLKSDTEVVYV